MTLQQVWTEKYRPQNIENAILSDDDKKFFSELTDIPNNLLFIGSPGIGKSTIAKILAKKFSPNAYLYINASEQGNIETVRNLISDFISVSSIDGKQKIIILDEADGISLIAQQALRSVMEEYLDTCKFILTANYKNKLIEAIRSRCQEFNFCCSEKQLIQRVVEIVKAEKVVVEKDQVSNLRTLVKQYFPDIRKTINELQKCCYSGKFIYKSDDKNDFVSSLKKDIDANESVFIIRQKLVDHADGFGNDYHFLMKGLFNLYSNERDVHKCLIISEYLYRHVFVLDQEINFCALLFNLNAKK
jgi:DNA polymerase III delta prime subunit